MALDGMYEVVVKSPMGDEKGTVEFQTNGGELTGSGKDSKGGVIPVEGGKMNGTDFTFHSKLNSPLGVIDVDFVGTAAGDALSGEVKSNMGNFKFTGKKI